jgi:hypothetical protein
MPAPILVIGHGNGHNKPGLVDFVKDADADSFSALEAHRLIDDLDAVARHRIVGGDEGFTEPRNRANTTVIVTANRNPNLGSLTRLVSERIEKIDRIAPDRVLRVSFFEHPLAKAVGFEGIAHFGLHPDATVARHRDPKHPIVREYREALDSTRRWMSAARHDGLLPVLTGDLQVNDRFRADWGPRAQIIDPLQMNARAVRIDWLIYPRELTLAGRLETRELYDHTGFVARLRAA